MRSARQYVSILAIIWAVSCPSVWRWTAAAGESQDGSAAALVRTLIEDPDAGAVFTIPCGESSIARSAAAQLTDLGSSAVPAIEDALDLIEAQDRRRAEIPNTRLILDAYVRIKGQTAYPRILKMTDGATMPTLQVALDDSVASLLGLTSAVSFRAGRTSLRTDSISSCRSLAPRDALDRLIVAWEAGSRPAVEASLSPSAAVELSGQLAGISWESFRANYSRVPGDRGVTIGYRFVTTSTAQPGAVRIATEFETASGQSCGTTEISFAAVPLVSGRPDPKRYLVGSSDLTALLRLISSCSVEAARKP